ncbi:uncharacterized protein PHACADRAFT_175408 [Phanerochaete carnosa HHB-10118-sp]|uniref:non-specific serine/threonine protein kinase n=1 Tax=Phanerochaete carnosa (strain HHB-10118-sp) TaxID=650164 RepID=K5WRC6_PHACS|nr:uncharacterized protein PHACADRAFT_175408 [Phanerochaete carnosa HHB-10118-sp]EKM52927.1 hypothetical protein PHACADRAFT_175408 [Phanerochaete carnosa HHB-10118-sp]
MSEKKQSEVFPLVKGYELFTEIGGGGFSVVYRAVNFNTSAAAACKVVSLAPDTPKKARDALNKEIAVHLSLKHANVLEFIDYIIIEPLLPKSSSQEKGSASRKRKRDEVRREDKDDEVKTEEREYGNDDGQPKYHPGYYMLLEIAGGGDLFDKIEPDKGVGIDVAQHYFRQLAAGVEYIHERGVCHRDLKPENLLLDSGGVLKITDFGLCSVFKITDAKTTRLLSERCGSKPYIAPELVGTAPYEAEPVDIWGLGIILYTLLSGNTPWDQADNNAPEYVAYLEGSVFNHAPWSTFDRDALSLITGMLTPDPAQRMRLQDIFHHKWMMRENELTRRGAVSVAEALTQSLRSTGDLDIATPPSLTSLMLNRTDRDGDQIMLTAAHYSQFTQTLLLFSQTSSGQRYTPGWTRFYSSLPPEELKDIVVKTLEKEGTKYRVLAPKLVPRAGEEVLDDTGEGEDRKGDMITRHRIRIGGFDRRKLMYRGTIEIEEFEHGESKGAFCVMNREKGNPISWRQLWKGLIMSPLVEPHVLRKRAPASS